MCENIVQVAWYNSKFNQFQILKIYLISQAYILYTLRTFIESSYSFCRTKKIT